MASFIVRRILALIPVLFVVSLVIFALVYSTPGDPARVMLGMEASEDQILALRKRMGLDLPAYQQYFIWITGVFQGDLGTSAFLKMPVLQAILTYAQPTLLLAILAQLFSIVVAVPLGALAAKLRGKAIDHAVMVMTLVGMAIPSFVLALFLSLIFGVQLRLFPTSGYVSPFEDIIQFIRHVALPIVALGAVQAALLMRTTRAAVLDSLDSDYVVSARSRGVSENRLLFGHTLRNAALPVLTVAGVTFATLLAGAVVTETIFNIPGLGMLLVKSLARRDYIMLQGVVLFTSLIYLTINLLVDLSYGIVDPRTRLSGGRKNGSR